MASAPAEALRRRVGDNPAAAWVQRQWQTKGPRGAALRFVTLFVVLLGGLRLVLHNNPAPLGVIVFGGIIGLLYALVAFGLILVYRANRIINFAQAEIGAAPALLGVLLVKLHHVPYLVALPISLAAGVLAGFLVEIIVVRRLGRAPRLVLSVATIGVAEIFAVLQFYMPHWLGAKRQIDATPPRTPFTSFKFTLKPVIFHGDTIVIVVAAILVVIGLTAFFRFTDIGIGVRASAENADRATLLGISVKRLSTIVWMLAAGLSALSVFLRVPVTGLPVGADIGPAVLLFALAAAVIARMESFGVAFAAGIAIGITEQSIYFFSRDPGIAQAVMLPVLLVVMLLQRSKLSRGQDSGLSSYKQVTEFRPIPPEMRHLPEVAWGRFGLAAIGAVIMLGLPYAVGLKQQILSSVVLIYAIVAVSLVILTGFAGQISLGQWGLSGIGALVAGGLAAHLHADFFVTLLAAGAAGAVASLLIGLPALRIQGLYLAVTTIAFALAVQVYLLSPTYFPHILPNNFQTIQRPLLYGRYSIAGPRAYYYVTLIFLALALGSAHAVRKSRAGRVMIAARDNERGAQSYGISVARARIAAFAISGFWAAVAGALFAYNQRALDVASFDYTISELLLIIVVIGGVTSLSGAILGALFIGALKYGNFSPQFQNLASAAGVLLLLMFLPGGLAQVVYGGRDAVLRWLAERRGLVVPSLVADMRVRDERAEEADAVESLVHAPAMTSTDEDLLTTGIPS